MNRRYVSKSELQRLWKAWGLGLGTDLPYAFNPSGYWVWGSTVSYPNSVWREAPVKIEFGAYLHNTEPSGAGAYLEGGRGPPPPNRPRNFCSFK